MHPRIALATSLLVTAILCWGVSWGAGPADPHAADANTPLDGAWVMTPLTESFTVQQWSGACGPAPVSGTSLGGGPATVKTEGGELQIALDRRTFRTNACIDPMPTLTPETHSADGRTWRTRCVTPSGDPRRAVVNTAFFRSGDALISVAETGRYEFTIRGSRCVADVTRQATLNRVIPTSVPATASSTPRAADPVATTAGAGHAADACASPGDPARLEIRPSRKLLRTGESYRFRAIVVDENGCPTRTPIQWSVSGVRTAGGDFGAVGPSVDGTGRLDVPDVPLSDAKLDVVATAAGRSARASVEITSPDGYEQLLARSGLDSNGERDEPSVTRLATSAIGAIDAQAQGGARHRRSVFLAIVGGLAFVLTSVGVFGALRARKARAAERAAQARHEERLREYEREKAERERRHASQMRVHLESVERARKVSESERAVGASARGPGCEMVCPFCGREFGAGSVYCPFDANRLVARGTAARGTDDPIRGASGAVAAGGICPTCRRGYNPGVRVCPRDGDELVPAALAGPPPPTGTSRGKICPTCGERFEGAAAFCGKDGTQLVLLN